MGRSFLQNKVRANSSSIKVFTSLGIMQTLYYALFLWTFQQVSWLDDGDDGLADICKASQSLSSCFAHTRYVCHTFGFAQPVQPAR